MARESAWAIFELSSTLAPVEFDINRSVGVLPVDVGAESTEVRNMDEIDWENRPPTTTPVDLSVCVLGFTNTEAADLLGRSVGEAV